MDDTGAAAGSSPTGAAHLAAWTMTDGHLLAILDACPNFCIWTETPSAKPPPLPAGGETMDLRRRWGVRA